jgi:hypothetical protein
MAAPAVTVHSLAQAVAALGAAARAETGIVLLSAPGAAAYAGPAWFAEVLAVAAAEAGTAPAAAYLDCGPRPGDALAALRAGVPGVIFTGRTRFAGKLRALAHARGAAFRTERPDSLDLLDRADPQAAVADYLADR